MVDKFRLGGIRLRDMGDGTWAEVVSATVTGAPAALGQATMAASSPVVLASDQLASYAMVTPAGQVSTASTVVLAGCEFDARGRISLCYTISVATNAVSWSVWGANAANYSDEVAVLEAVSVATSGVSSYIATLAPYAYYRVKIIDTVGASHGTATVRGIVKA
jgi:hypothetical protein